CLEGWHVSQSGYEDAGHQDTGTLRGTITGRDDGRPEPSQHVGNNARGNNGGYRRCCDGNSNRDDDLARGGLYDDGDEDQLLQTPHQGTPESGGNRGETGKTRRFCRGGVEEPARRDSGEGQRHLAIPEGLDS